MSNWTEKDLQNRPGVRNVSDSRESATRFKFPQGGKGEARKPSNDPEAQEQREFFKIVRSLETIYPELQMVRSDQAGMRTHPAQANKAKAGGMRRGFPDIDVPIARGGYTGMHIEMKSQRGQLTEDQKWWLAQLRDQDRKCVVCRSARQAWEKLIQYLGIEQEV
jgi:hypothetical protein